MSTQNTRAVPIRTIIMILISAAIILAAVGVHGLLTRNDDPQAALNAQEAKIKAASTETAQPAAATPAVCLISVAKAPVAETRDTLKKAGFTVQGENAADWPNRPAAPRATTVYFEGGGEDAAKTISTALPGSATAARPAGLEACAGALAVAVVRK
ncbi:LytR family transcriptional regulator [Tsukamurella asaccharolytica]|uniref:LytR family transcriptional regulator n=1 Tax=Tsukamurella asaccharolytica TaxID=2592067 RepID=A0A5C5RES1_9ACTN|nr:LytR C-terminal domain-containing protein [Tsukamurella asaccharolytica]TWS21202.1 LytR family transcriptional regulator [Tsukamurella asaccharolytica]